MIFLDFRNSYSGLLVASCNIILIFWVSVCKINLKLNAWALLKFGYKVLGSRYLVKNDLSAFAR